MSSLIDSILTNLPEGWERVYDEASSCYKLINNTTNPPTVAYELPASKQQQGLAFPPQTGKPATQPDEALPTQGDGMGTNSPEKAGPRKAAAKPPAKRSNKVFTALELQQMVAETALINPYLAPRNSRGEHWARVLKQLHSQGLCLESSADTVKHKVEALLKHHENPNPRSEISRELAKRPSIEIELPSRLDNLAGLKENAAKVRDDKKAEEREEENAKLRQGAYIRDMAMKTMSSDEGDSGSDAAPAGTESESGDKENHASSEQGTPVPRRRAEKRKKASSKPQRASKRRRLDTSLDDMMDMLQAARDEDRRDREAERRQRQERDERLLAIMEESSRAQRAMQERMLVAIAGLAPKGN
ncbi:hypothetical protein VTO73DRAFT_4200 [Trametes versicolor]